MADNAITPGRFEEIMPAAPVLDARIVQSPTPAQMHARRMLAFSVMVEEAPTLELEGVN